MPSKPRFLRTRKRSWRRCKTIESGTSTGTLQAPTLIVPGQETPYTIDGDGPLYTLLDGRSASFTTIDEGTEINKYARLGASNADALAYAAAERGPSF